MKKTIKTISFTLLILSLGLVLSACNNEDNKIKEQLLEEQELENQEEQEQAEEIKETENEEVNEVSTEENSDISKWRDYDNEYFNLKFKYHQNWYFQRDNLNTNNYIAVYGFSPNVEELNNKEYAIRLFILNSTDNFTEDFNLIKAKEENNKKYILVSSNQEYQEILDLMFKNLEITGAELTENQKDEKTEEQSNKKDDLVEMNEFFYQDSKNEFRTNSSELVIRNYFKSDALAENAKGCAKDLDQDYFENILEKFSENEIGHSYVFIDINTQEMVGHYQIIIIPNNLGYANLEEFKQDFELCEAGAEAYPTTISENYLLFENSCGSGMSSPSAEVCVNTKSKISPTIKLK